MTQFKKEVNVRLKDAGSTGWPELHGRTGVVKDVIQDGKRLRVFFETIGWLDFGPEELEIVAASGPT